MNGVCFSFGMLALLVTGVQASTPPPWRNVVLIVSDDQRPDTIHALDGLPIRTPHLDRMVAEGSALTRCYAGYPICYASRAQILTGCCAFRALDPYPSSHIRAGLALLPQTLAEAGWRTWFVGKWHNDGTPHTRGYQLTRGWFGAGGARGIQQPERDERGRPLTGYRGWTFKTDAGVSQPELGVGLTPNISERFADAAVSLIHEEGEKAPFFLHVNFTAPHDPRLVPRGLETAYKAADFELPKNFAPDHPFDHGNAGGRDEVLLERPLVVEEVAEEWAVYAAILEHLDAQVGRILTALEEEGLLDETLVVFTSDQGLALGSHGLLGKQNMYEHSIRSPMIVRGPGVTPGRRSAALCYLWDLFPTFCHGLGIEVPETVQGLDLGPVLRGEKDGVRQEVFGAFTDTQRMICEARWKLIDYPKAGRRQLFDLKTDPDETQDLSEDPSQAARVQDMLTRLDVWRREQGDPTPPPPR